MSQLQKNLAGVGRFTATTASLIQSAAIPEGFLPARGSDNSPTFLRTSGNPRELEWLGNTSMPTASADPLIAALDAGSSSGLGLSIGTGHEWLALLQKLGSGQTLFVYEPDPALLKMALSICDLSAQLAEGKILLFTGPAEAAANDLANFLGTHLGHEPPTVLHPLPTVSAERRNWLLAAGESIVRHGLQTRQIQTHTLAAKLQQHALEDPLENRKAESGNFALALLATARYPNERPLHWALPPGTPQLRLDHHASASVALRLQFLLEHRPHRILSDFFRPQLACIPACIAIHTWIPPLIGPAFWQPCPAGRLPSPNTLLPHDRIIVHSAVHQLLLESHGIPNAQIELRPLTAAPRNSEFGIQNSEFARIALLADLPRTDAASLGLQLPTHQAIYAAAVDLVTADYLAINFHSAADILRRALAKAGVSGASDPALQDPMLRLIRDVLIPSLPLLTVARNLLDHQIPLLLIGDWANLDRPRSDLCSLEAFTAFCSCPTRWEQTAAIVHLSPWGTVSPLVLEAAAAGVQIIAPRHPTDSLPGTLPTLLPANANYLRPQPQQLLATIKSVLRRRAP